MATTQVWNYRGVETDVDLTGYEVEATDGSIGTIETAVSEVGQNYLVIDTGPWIFGRRVLLPAGVVDRIDTAEEKVYVDRSREEIKNAPEYERERGATEAYRERVGSYYAGREVGRPRSESRPASTTPTNRRRASRPRTSSSARARSSSASSRRSSTGRSSSTRARGRTRRRTQARASDEPTRDELYEQAKRLGVEGRSKMNKTQLKRAVSRRGGRSGSTQRARSASTQRRGRSTGQRRKATPVEVQSFLDGVSYPTRKGDLLREAERRGASRTVRSTLERLPEERFADPTEVSEAIGSLRR
jgi:Protein of unknown function (DUF2795)